MLDGTGPHGRWRVAVPALILVAVNLWVFWPSFFHIFRHDDWHMYFLTKGTPRGLGYIVKYTELALYQKHDRLLFRPLHFGGVLALDRVLFDTHYVGRHIMAFLRHLACVFLLWGVLRQAKPNGFAWLFALLFSVLVPAANVVMWPHMGGYMLLLFFELAAIAAFRATVAGRRAPANGFFWTGLSSLLALLAAEAALPVPFVLFGAYWLWYRRRARGLQGRAAGAASLFLLAPVAVWAGLYALHLCLAWPFWQMTGQSRTLPLWVMGANTVRFLALILRAIAAPSLVGYTTLDAMVFVVRPAAVFWAAGLLAAVALGVAARKVRLSRELGPLVVSGGVTLGTAAIFCLARAAHIESSLNELSLSSHYAYNTGALLLLALFDALDLGGSRWKRVLAGGLLVLAALHGVRTRQTGYEIGRRTRPLRDYFDQVTAFVKAHEDEPDFTFKLVDRPPRPHTYAWYHQTCIESFFGRFIDNERPKFVVGYDYELEAVFLEQPPVPAELPPDPIPRAAAGADYTNSLGMRFVRCGPHTNQFLMGVFEVTQTEWTALMGGNPSVFKSDDRPVENVSYRMIRQFIRRLNRMEGKPVYRLPSVNEWYLTLLLRHRKPYGLIDEVAWYRRNAKGMTHSTGTRAAYPAGVYDMRGNVWEWCDDVIGYDPYVQPLPDVPRICLGGSWRDRENRLFWPMETHYPPDFHYAHLGFRLVRELDE